MHSTAPPLRSPPSRWASSRAAALLLAAVGVGAYSNSFSVPFHYDDRVVILGEPAITGFRLAWSSRRFLGDLSFALCYRLFGDRPLGYHVVNLGIHLASALLVYALVRALFSAPSLERSRIAPHAPAVALAAGLLFVGHPVQTQAVTYVVQRYASLAALFFLAATLCYVRFRIATSRAWYVGFLAAALAAFWTKENAFVLPLVVLALELSLFNASAARRLLFLSPFVLALIVGAAALASSGVSFSRLDALTRVDTAMSRADYLLTQVRVVARYLQLLAVPIGQNLDHDVSLSTSIAEPRVIAALLLHLGLGGGAALAFARGRSADPAWRLVGVGIAWFYLSLLVESSIVPIVDVMYEHRVYLPSVGVFLAAAIVLALAVPPPRAAWRATVATAVAALTVATFSRNRVWRDDLALWTDAARKSPGKARPLMSVGVALFERGRVAEAAEAYRAALRADPSYLKASFNLGEALQALGDCRGAIPEYLRFASVHPRYPQTYRNLARCYEQLGDPTMARLFEERFARESAREGPLPPFYR